MRSVCSYILHARSAGVQRASMHCHHTQVVAAGQLIRETYLLHLQPHLSSVRACASRYFCSHTAPPSMHLSLHAGLAT